MKSMLSNVARTIRRFTEHPTTRLLVGLVLFLTALFEIEQGLLIELGEKGVQSHHGIAAFGLLTMIAAVPDLLEALIFWAECLEDAHIDGSQE